MPLTVILLPAEIVPVGIGFVAAVTLVAVALGDRKHQKWTVGALVGVVVATTALALFAKHLPGFLHGLRDRYVAELGYAQMRDFAREVSQDKSLLGPYGMIQRPSKWDSSTGDRRKRWDALASRYPFLNRTRLLSRVSIQDGYVQVDWGGALIGQWGFQISPRGAVPNMDTKHWRVLRVADDIQFFRGG